MNLEQNDRIYRNNFFEWIKKYLSNLNGINASLLELRNILYVIIIIKIIEIAVIIFKT